MVWGPIKEPVHAYACFHTAQNTLLYKLQRKAPTCRRGRNEHLPMTSYGITTMHTQLAEPTSLQQRDEMCLLCSIADLDGQRPDRRVG